MLVPDEVAAKVYYEEVAPQGARAKHCFLLWVHYPLWPTVPPSDVDVFMVVPKSPGHLVRRMYVEAKAPALWLYIKITPIRPRAGLAYARGIVLGRCNRDHICGRTETILYEQVVLQASQS